jgi:NAD(P)-dependent dehydrogenase (short-subunit alcohol dehydrogenase family)
MSSKWTAADVPDQSGRVAIVTGANTGIGYGAAAVTVQQLDLTGVTFPV